MKKTLLSTLSCTFLLSSGLVAQDLRIPEQHFDSRYEYIPDVAQYKGSDWDNVVGMAHKVSLERAFKIADRCPEITYFFYTKAIQLVLEAEDGFTYRIFHEGDAVFFSGEPWWGDATDFADGYVKKK
jgi:hypothetical protein